MEVDLDSLLRSHGTSSSDDDEVERDGYRRTVDEILNDSDTSSYSSGCGISPRASFSSLALGDAAPIGSFGPPGVVEEVKGFPTRMVSGGNVEELSAISTPGNGSRELSRPSVSSSGIRGSSSFSSPRLLPPLFGGVRSNAKPGAALAAAAAASRSIPTPHAAAILSRRASASSLDRISQFQDSAEDFVAEENFNGLERENHSTNGHLGGGLSAESDTGRKASNSESSPSSPSSSSQNSNAEDDEILARLDNAAGASPPVAELRNPEETVAADRKMEASEDVRVLSSGESISLIEPSPVPHAAADDRQDEASSLFNEFVADEVDKISQGEDISSFEREIKASSVSEVLEEDSRRLESNERASKKAERRLQSSMKPLEWAEYVEKRQASSGLDWEEGAVAQPMRLEGIVREPPAVGYLQINSQNPITHAFSSQSFLRDHGSPQTLAVHMNSIAVGTSKGLVLIFSSKYSPHGADNIDAKMAVLGFQGDKPQSPVTSMCFNQQGDLLLVGYSDGHITAWDVQRSIAAKVITGEHAAPVIHTLFLGQDSQVTRQFKVVTGDSKGVVLLHTFSVVPLLNRFTIKTQCLLDGRKTGTVLSASPLLLDDLYTGPSPASGGSTVSNSGLGSMVGGVVGGVVGGESSGWKLHNEGNFVEEGVVVFVTHQNALVVRFTPSVEVYAQFCKPDGVREGSMPYTAWKCTMPPQQTNVPDRVAWLAIAWNKNVEVFKLMKSDLTKHCVWVLDSEAIGIEWLDDQMLVILTLRGYLCLYTRDGDELHRTSFLVDMAGRDDIIAYHTYFTNNFGNPEKAFHNSIGVRGATVYILGSMHLTTSRLLPWKERIQTLRKAGDWMGALDLAMRLYDGQAHGVIDLPKAIDDVREAIMPYMLEMIVSYVDEVFSYISVAHGHQIGKESHGEVHDVKSSYERTEIDEQFARVGGVAVEFCTHIKRTDIIFDDIFSRFTAAGHAGTFLEILEPYILKDMLGSLPPEIMQALVEHYSNKGWLQRVEQCVLHMDISSLDFNQVIRLCREHGLYSALIYLFNRGLDDYRTPLEELLVVVQSNQRTVAAIGYKMLVYLKYCFLGLAFPPGHDNLHLSRLSSVRKELLQFLLEDSSALTSPVIKSVKSSCGTCPNLYYLLWLDTESTLEVIRCAFSDEPFMRLNNMEYCSETNTDETDAIQCTEDLNILVQSILNSLILILDMESNIIRSFEVEENGIIENWPSKRDVGHVIEFIAFFITCKKATASGKVLKHILEYLTSDFHQSVGPGKRNGTSQREKQVLSLLKVVPHVDWDLSSVLDRCLEAHFYQACGLIHTFRGQHIAALDSYMKDSSEPFYAFAFVFDRLSKLNESESSTFRFTVLTRIPELVKLSREDTFLLVIDQFNKESQQLMSQLQSHPQSLFLFLKTAVDVHLHGTLKFPIFGDSQMSDGLLGTKTAYAELSSYLDRVSNFTKLLQQNPFNIDEETAELYLELLCQYECGSVLSFLETFESYKLEHCLRLCQQYHVNDAAAFLLERAGDVGSALELIMSGLGEKFSLLSATLEKVLLDMSSRNLCSVELLDGSLKMDEVSSVYQTLHSAIGLCQRNTQRLEPLESEFLWFRLLDLYCEQLRELYNRKENPPDVQLSSMSSPMVRELVRSDLLRSIFSKFIKEIVEGMVGFVPLPAIMGKILAENGGQEFGDFKLTLLGLLGTYGYERRILGTAKLLIEDDTFYTMSLLRKGASHAYAPQSLVCCLCDSLLGKGPSSSSIRVFSCGHATHLHCEPQEDGVLDRDSSVGCPVCMPKRKALPPRSKSILMENRLIRNSSKMIRGTNSVYHLHEPEATERLHVNPQISRFEILSNLQEAKKLLLVDPLPQLKLAPPSIYHEKVQKGIDILQKENSSSLIHEKPNRSRQIWDSKSKGFSKRFPLKTNIFGKERRSGTR